MNAENVLTLAEAVRKRVRLLTLSEVPQDAAVMSVTRVWRMWKVSASLSVCRRRWNVRLCDASTRGIVVGTFRFGRRMSLNAPSRWEIAHVYEAICKYMGVAITVF